DLDRVAGDAHLRVFDVLAGLDVIAVPVPGTDHDVALDRALAQGPSSVLAHVVDGEDCPLEVEQRHLHVPHRDDLGRAGREVLEVYDREIHGVSISFKLPAVMRLLKMVKLREAHRSVKFSRINIFTRDGFRCQYCRRKFRTEDLTFDHVIPIAKGGNKTWEN